MDAIDQLAADVTKLYKTLPQRVGVLAKRFVDQNFRLQAWQGSSIEAWARRKAIEKNQSQRALLIKSGRLRRATSYSSGTGYVLLRNNTPYAQIHNEGGTIAGTAAVGQHTRRAHTRNTRKGVQAVRDHSVRQHTRKMNTRIAKRQFMGDSPIFDQKLDSHILKALDNIEKQFIQNKKQ